ncbi:MAG: thiamine pyrophosphate-dependent dehydrogenase E1 component subunit alpha [Bacteroidota bacterium]
MEFLERVFYKSYLIREVENTIENLFSKGALRGTVHGCRGQEAVPVIISELVNIKNDFLCGGHRSHGLALAVTNNISGLIGELMGKDCGYAHGKGGSQHVFYENFFTNGLTGGMVPVAAGLAFSQKIKTDNSISVVNFGDGAMNEGYVMETLNIASIKKLPLLFLLENNGYAMSTPVDTVSAGTFEKRIESFDIPYYQVTLIDFIAAFNLTKEVVSQIRKFRTPAFIEYKTHRFSGHSKSDKREYVSSGIDEFWLINDYLKKLENALPEKKVSEIKISIEQSILNSMKVCEESLFVMPENI